MALAALKTPAQKATQPTKHEGQRLSTLAALMCKRDDFVPFIRRIYDIAMGGNGSGCGDVTPEDFGNSVELYARHCVMVLCGLKESRSELDTSAESAQLFREKILKPWAEYRRVAEPV